MQRSGIQFPDVVDVTTQAPDGTIRLILAESKALTGPDIPALKQKLDNYMLHAQQTLLKSPATDKRAVCMRVDLYAAPDQLVTVFLRHYRTLLDKQGFCLEVSLNQQDLLL